MPAFEGEPGVRAAFPEERCRNLPGQTDPQTDPVIFWLAERGALAMEGPRLDCAMPRRSAGRQR